MLKSFLDKTPLVEIMRLNLVQKDDLVQYRYRACSVLGGGPRPLRGEMSVPKGHGTAEFAAFPEHNIKSFIDKASNM